MTSIATRRTMLLGASVSLCPLTWSAFAESLSDFDSAFKGILDSGDDLRDAANRLEAKELSSSGFSASQIDIAKSERLISRRAIDLIVFFEVSSESVYQSKYRGAIWPRGKSGVTVGIGYDLGYVSEERIDEDWNRYIDSDQLELLKSAAGLRGDSARDVLNSLSKVDIPFSIAFDQFRYEALPRYTALTESVLPNTSGLSDDSLGALVSLTYNRGPSYSVSESRDKSGRYREMRAIRSHMEFGRLSSIANEIKSMVRLWDVNEFPGLHKRRQLEASLFEAGL